MKPASYGTGLVAGGAVRSVLEVVGIKNILTKSIRLSSKNNMLHATVNGLISLKTIEEVEKLRNISIK